MQTVKLFSIIIMSLAYIWAGVQHFIDPDWFVKIMPRYLPLHYQAVYVSGFFEILLGGMLLHRSTRYLAAWGLMLLLIAVYPANIYLAFDKVPQEAIGVSSFVASWVRLPLQFVLIGIAYWHSKDIQ